MKYLELSVSDITTIVIEILLKHNPNLDNTKFDYTIRSYYTMYRRLQRAPCSVSRSRSIALDLNTFIFIYLITFTTKQNQVLYSFNDYGDYSFDTCRTTLIDVLSLIRGGLMNFSHFEHIEV